MKVFEFKDYCGKLVLKNRIYLFLIAVLLLVAVFLSVRPKVAEVPGSRYLLFTVLKYNYTPLDYEKTFLPFEFTSPLIDREKLIKTVKEERLYSYFRPKRAEKVNNDEDVWIVCGKRTTFTDSPSFRKLRSGRFCVRLKNIGGKIFVDREWWK